MASLSLLDAITKAGLDARDVLFIRHPLSNPATKKCVENGHIRGYTACQGYKFNRKEKYWLVFLGESGTSAKLVACYKVIDRVDQSPKHMPEGFPYPEHFDMPGYYFILQDAEIFGDLIDRLIIDWGLGARSWYQSAITDKQIIAIQEQSRHTFSGFEDLILSYGELKEIIDDPVRYGNWHTALKSVYAIYLISDTKTGKLYVGSASSTDGLFARWKCYINTHTGHNMGMIDAIAASPNQYHHFQFSILQIIPKTATSEDVIKLESLYKNKLLSRQFGMNQN